MSMPLHQSIVDICHPIFQWVNESEKSDVFETKYFLSKLLLDIETDMKQAGMKDSVWQEAKFVLCAFVDEMILKRGDDFAQAWSRESLQLQYFKEQVAGERFFERLSYLQKFSERRYDLMALYYWCLMLGYEGKYTEHELGDIRTALRHDLEQPYIQKQQKSVEDALVAFGIEAEAPTKKKRTFPFRIVMASLLAGIAAIYGAHYWLADMMVRQIKGPAL